MAPRGSRGRSVRGGTASSNPSSSSGESLANLFRGEFRQRGFVRRFWGCWPNSSRTSRCIGLDSASRSIKSSTLTVLVKGKSMAWFFILFADLFEIAWPFVLKWATPFSRWAPLLVGVLCAVPVNYLLAEAVQRLPAATVYASFVGVATAGTAMVGMVLFGESTNAGRICSLALILLGLIGLNRPPPLSKTSSRIHRDRGPTVRIRLPPAESHLRT